MSTKGLRRNSRRKVDSQRRLDIEIAAAAQGVQPIPAFDKFMSGWTDPCPGETADEMIAAIRAWRREGRQERDR